MRCVRLAALLRTTAKHAEAADQLESEPDSNRHVGGNVGKKAKQDYGHTSLWMQQYVTTQHARDRTGSTKTRNEKTVRIGCENAGRKHMRQRLNYAAQQIKNYVLHMPETILDVVTKDPQEEHITGDVRDAAVHEHRRYERQVNRTVSRAQPRHDDSLPGDWMFEHARLSDDVSAAKNFCGNS